ncbi:hypothetical protein TNCV_4527621 [Trichonephila clavipes]|nr:hypothetical protein TNCV_4527621 [Trichonephila clavipes]
MACKKSLECPFGLGTLDRIKFLSTISHRQSSGTSLWGGNYEFEPSTTKDPPCIGQRCTLNLSRTETSSRWCGVVVRRGGVSSGVVHVT